MHVGASSDGILYSLLLGTLQCIYTVPYGGNYLTEKLLRIGGKYNQYRTTTQSFGAVPGRNRTFL